MPNEDSSRASFLKSDFGSAFAPVRKWMISIRLVLPAPFLVCLSVAPALFLGD